MSVAVVVVVVTVSIAVGIPMIIVIVTASVIVVVFVLAVMVAVVVADFFAVLMTAELLLPSTVTGPVGVLAANRERAVVAEAWIVSAVDVATEADGSVEPWTCSEEDSAAEPGWSVVAEGSAIVRSVVVVAVRADRLGADVDRDVDLSFQRGFAEAEKREESEREKPRRFHLDSPWDCALEKSLAVVEGIQTSAEVFALSKVTCKSRATVQAKPEPRQELHFIYLRITDLEAGFGYNLPKGQGIHLEGRSEPYLTQLEPHLRSLK